MEERASAGDEWRDCRHTCSATVCCAFLLKSKWRFLKLETDLEPRDILSNLNLVHIRKVRLGGKLIFFLTLWR